MKLKTLIVDDEKLAREMLCAFLDRLDSFMLVGCARNTREAAEILARESVDLLLLDVQMPKQLGTDFLRSLSNPPLVVFTTAYARYALGSYEFNAVDYLLKPIGFSRFQEAMGKVQSRWETQRKAAAFEAGRVENNRFITVKEGYTVRKILLREITHVSAMREYVCYHTANGKIMELRSITKVAASLRAEDFFRIHRSYLVAKRAVESCGTRHLRLFGGQELPIGKTYRQRVTPELFLP